MSRRTLLRSRNPTTFIPLLFYFRFAEPYYSVSQITTVLFDTVSLLKSAPKR